MPAYRVRVGWTGLSGAPYLSTFYVGTGTVPDPQGAITVVDGFLNGIDTYVSNSLSWTTETEVFTFSTPDTVTAVTATIPSTGPGIGSGDQLPHASQGLVRWATNTLVGNRRVKGRTFLPGMLETNCNSIGGLAPSMITGVTAAAALLAPYLVIPSRTANLFAPVAGSSVWGQFAVLRSRRD